TVDLHLHSTASDGQLEPEVVVERAARAGLAAIALTDHDTLAGVAAAQQAGHRLGVRVIGGCEFSVSAPWGEMHVLGYFLPPDSAELNEFLQRCREDRIRRGRAMAERLQALGVPVTFDDILAASGHGAVGRPHVARAIIAKGAARDLNDAFDRFLGRGRPAYVPKTLPPLREVTRIVHQVGGLLSAAHLKDRATRSVLERFRRDGLDAVETRHPSHGPDSGRASPTSPWRWACSAPVAATGMATRALTAATAPSAPRRSRPNGSTPWRPDSPREPGGPMSGTVQSFAGKVV